ncbi:MAG: glycosyltransferase [Trueperaceae bacterium]|nr:glycosyltransferase [Trueperaceae bacterium]
MRRGLEPPLISVITVCTGRDNLLREKVTALETQTLAPNRFEWVVLLNGPSNNDHTRAYLQSLDVPFGLTVLTSEETLPAGAARNRCIGAARGDTVYLSDDDCLPEPGTLAKHLDQQQRAPCVAVGSIDFVADDQVADDQIADGHTETWRPKKVYFWNVNGANSSAPREAVLAVGGFDETLRGYGGEDLLLGYLLHRHGLPIVALPDANVLHVGLAPQQSGNADKAYSAGRNAYRIAQKYPALAWRLGAHPLLVGLKSVALYTPIAVVWRGLEPRSYHYEHAYFRGYLEERHHARTQPRLSDRPPAR